MAQAFITPERIGVSLLFLMNGFMMGSFAPKVPDFAARLGLSESGLGLLILMLGVGSIVFMPIAGAQIARRGSRRVSIVVAALFTPTLLLLTAAPTVWLAVPAIFLFGGLIGAMDVAMNANAVSTERHMQRSIMSSCHAFWSLGGLIGSSLGGPLLLWTGTMGHSLIATLIGAVMLAFAFPRLFQDQPAAAESAERTRLPRSPLPWLIGIIALFCMVPEGTVADWSALYLRKELGGDVVISGYGYAAFSLTMAIMRFLGDGVRDRFGAVKTLQFCAVMAMLGLLIVGFAPSIPLALLGFALMGIGISNLVPIAFSAAGNLPGLRPGVGLSVVTTLGYSGILVAPSLIGFVAEHTSLTLVFRCLPVLLIVVLFLSRLARYADGETRPT